MPAISKKDNVPFLPHEDSGPFFVIQGLVNIYHCKISPEGQPTGQRIFLFQMLEGELFLPLKPYTRSDGTTTGLLAITAKDCSLNKAVPKLSRVMRPYINEFVEKCYRRLGYFREQIEIACAELDEIGVEGFIDGFMRKIDEDILDEVTIVQNSNRRRYTSDSISITNSLDTLCSVVPGNVSNNSALSDNTELHPLVMACSAVAQANGIKISVPRALSEGKVSDDNIVESIALASRFRSREVILTDKWYRQDGGNLLGKIEETGEPVALLQKNPRQYECYNPVTGKRIIITKKNVNNINPKAIMFYRSLPMHKLTGKEILSYVIKGTGKADWMWVLLMGLLGGILGMLSPEITGKIFDTVIPDGDRNMIMQIGFLMAAVSFSVFACEVTRAYALQRISGGVERDLQSGVWDRLLSLPISFFKKYTAGELAEKAMSISKIQQIISGTVINSIITSIFSVFYLIVMFTKSVRLSWIGLAIIFVTTIITLVLGWLQLKYEDKQLAIDNKIAGRMFGWLSGFPKIKMTGSEKRTFFNWAKMYRESRTITFRKESIGNYSAVWNSMITILSSIIIYAVMFNLKDAVIATGAYIAFNAALGNLMQNSIQLSSAILSANVILPLYNEAKPIFEATPEYDEQKIEAPALTGDIELSRVSFRYNPEGPLIINDVSMRIRSGEHVALVGPSGSGKSTLFRILLAFEQPDSGDVSYDGISIDQLDIRSVRRQLGVVLQSGQLLNGSIFENVAGAKPNITHDQAMDAIRQAGMEDDLAQMPMGLHTVISDGAGTLSGGQRQRLMIARALAGNPKILFFDEATSALDNKTQKIVSDSVNKLKTTRVTIAHRLSTIQSCDRIIVLESGKITEQGTYDELMKLNGTFAMMAKRQMV